MFALSLMLAFAVATPTATSDIGHVVVAQSSADCQNQIDALRATAQSATYSGKNAEKEQAGLARSLDSATTTLSAGKYADTVKKLEDFKIKVQDLKASGKIDATSADALLAGADQAIACVQALGSAPA